MELSLRTRVRAGDKDAFGLLFEEHARAVYNHAFRLTGNWSTAEEVVSLTFLHLMTELHRMEPESPPLPASPRRKRPYGLFAVAGAGALAVAVAATVITTGHVTSVHPGSSPQASTPVAAGSPAAVLLARIASAAASQPAATVRDNEFMYIRSEVAYEEDTIVNGHGTATMEKPHERQVWLPVANICVTGLLKEGGPSTPLSPFPVVNGKIQPPPNPTTSLSMSPSKSIPSPDCPGGSGTPRARRSRPGRGGGDD